RTRGNQLMSATNPTRRLLLAVPLAALLGAACATPAQAGNLDRALLNETSKVFQYLGKNKYRTVGVLRFQVQKGSRKPAVDSSSLGDNMTPRLENALSMPCDASRDQRAARVIRPAARQPASRAPRWFSEPGQRKRLFGGTYQQAWGNQQVRPDCFLT